MFSIRKMLEVLGTDLSPEVSEKLTALRKALQEQKTQLRDDSVLAWNYVNGCLPKTYTFRYVVFELLLTRYLHEYTEYKELSYKLCGDPLFHPLVERSRENLRHWLLPAVKYQVLKKVGVPDTWPWMMEELR